MRSIHGITLVARLVLLLVVAVRLAQSKSTRPGFSSLGVVQGSSEDGGMVTSCRSGRYSYSSSHALLLLQLRGGEENDGEEGESDEEEEEEEENDDEADGGAFDLSTVMNKAVSVTQSTILPYTQKALTVVVRFTQKVTISTVKAVQRAIQAGLAGDDEENDVQEDGDDDDDGEEATSIVSKVLKTLQRMVKAALEFPEEEKDTDADLDDYVKEEDTEVDEEDEKLKSVVQSKAKPAVAAVPAAATSSVASDFGSFLSQSYSVTDERVEESGPAVLGGPLTVALQEARSQARLLVVFVPSTKAGRKSKGSKDQAAIKSLLSAEVAEAANKRARKTGEDTGSFLVWGAKAGSSEATTAIKRLKAQTTSSKGEKRPILLVVYPAMVVDSSGLPKLVPKVVAQHHCSPPPSSSLMAAWLSALRKRHAKQYSAMQMVLKELKYYQERKAGYTESKQSDKDREQRDLEEEAQRVAAEQAEKERQEVIVTRRKELKDSLSEEASGKDTKKIALRFSDGRSGQRRFAQDQSISDVFNWVDAMYELEREKVVLTTMNGKQTISWDDNEKMLSDVGLGKNTGFRVSEKEDEKESELAPESEAS